MFFYTCGLFLPSEMCLLSARPVECTGHLDYFLIDWWRLVNAKWQKELKRSYDRTTSRALVVSAVLLAPSAMRLLQQQYLVAWQLAHYLPCPPKHYGEALRAVSGWMWLDPKECLLVGAVGLAPGAVALLVVGQVPKRTNEMLTFAKWSFRNELSFCHLDSIFRMWSGFYTQKSLCYICHQSHRKHQIWVFLENKR